MRNSHLDVIADLTLTLIDLRRVAPIEARARSYPDRGAHAWILRARIILRRYFVKIIVLRRMPFAASPLIPSGELAPSIMPSPSHVKDAPEAQKSPKSLVIGDLTRDDSELTRHVFALARSYDDPPVLFDWDHEALTRFWNSAVAYAATAASPIVIPINGGVALPPVVDVEHLKREILSFVRVGAGNPVQPPYPEIIGTTLGLACTSTQCQVCAGILAGLELHPWFAAVLAHPAAHGVGQLASIWTPRPRVATGICNQVPLFCELWE